MIELKDIYFSYPGTKTDNPTLAGITLKINKGEFAGIFGPNGSGKSTLLKIISGLLLADEGSVLLEGIDLAKLNRRKIASKIAFVPQSTATIFPYTVYEIVAMGRTPHLGITGFETEKDHEIVNKALRTLELHNLSGKGINEISGGEAQRAFIARALAQEPEIILLDEPNSHLDIKHQIAIYKLLQKLNIENNITVIAVSHDLNLSAHFCKRGILLNKGRIESDNKIRDVLTHENIKTIFEIETQILENNDNELNVIIKP